MKAVEIIILIGAVAVVAGVIIAGLWKKKKGKGGCCGCDCSSCACCPAAKKKEKKEPSENPNK